VLTLAGAVTAKVRLGTRVDSEIIMDNALVNPKPVGEIPILLGGGLSPRAFRRIAEKGDG
jgi:hypothetical protein